MLRMEWKNGAWGVLAVALGLTGCVGPSVKAPVAQFKLPVRVIEVVAGDSVAENPQLVAQFNQLLAEQVSPRKVTADLIKEAVGMQTAIDEDKLKARLESLARGLAEGGSNAEEAVSSEYPDMVSAAVSMAKGMIHEGITTADYMRLDPADPHLSRGLDLAEALARQVEDLAAAEQAYKQATGDSSIEAAVKAKAEERRTNAFARANALRSQLAEILMLVPDDPVYQAHIWTVMLEPFLEPFKEGDLKQVDLSILRCIRDAPCPSEGDASAGTPDPMSSQRAATASSPQQALSKIWSEAGELLEVLNQHLDGIRDGREEKEPTDADRLSRANAARQALVVAIKPDAVREALLSHHLRARVLAGRIRAFRDPIVSLTAFEALPLEAVASFIRDAIARRPPEAIKYRQGFLWGTMGIRLEMETVSEEFMGAGSAVLPTQGFIGALTAFWRKNHVAVVMYMDLTVWRIGGSRWKNTIITQYSRSAPVGIVGSAKGSANLAALFDAQFQSQYKNLNARRGLGDVLNNLWYTLYVNRPEMNWDGEIEYCIPSSPAEPTPTSPKVGDLAVVQRYHGEAGTAYNWNSAQFLRLRDFGGAFVVHRAGVPCFRATLRSVTKEALVFSVESSAKRRDFPGVLALPLLAARGIGTALLGVPRVGDHGFPNRLDATALPAKRCLAAPTFCHRGEHGWGRVFGWCPTRRADPDRKLESSDQLGELLERAQETPEPQLRPSEPKHPWRISFDNSYIRRSEIERVIRP